MTIRLLTPEDAGPYQQLRLQALEESPTAFGNSHAEEAARALGEVGARLVCDPAGGKAVIGAFLEDRLVGMVALVREQPVKVRHRAELGGLYVVPEARGRGIGSALLDTALSHAHSWPDLRKVKLSVTSGNERAEQLYRSRGFERYGSEPEGLFVDGVYYDELLYQLCLTPR
ncbi:MAG: GNAT family N-acetyltransferase [Chthoniobacteraceae bacterium]